MDITLDYLRQQHKQLTAVRDRYVNEANSQLAAHNAAVSVLEQLIDYAEMQPPADDKVGERPSNGEVNEELAAVLKET